MTETFTGGTGRYVGVSGVLTGTTTTVVTSVDPMTGIAHKKVTNKEVGTLTFPTGSAHARPSRPKPVKVLATIALEPPAQLLVHGRPHR